MLNVIMPSVVILGVVVPRLPLKWRVTNK